MRTLVLVTLCLVGASFASPVIQLSDDATTLSPTQRDGLDATTQIAYSDDVGVTGESVTNRARQDAEDETDDEDDEATTVAVSSTKAPLPPPSVNESSVLSEFNYVSQAQPSPIVQQPQPVAPIQPVDPVLPDAPVQPVAPVVSQPASSGEVAGTQKPALEEGVPDESENEIVRDEAATTSKVMMDVLMNEGVNRNASELSLLTQGNDPRKPYTNFEGEARAGCQCGKLPFRIPVDEDTQINPSPWFGAIVRGGLFAGGRPHCGATLINNLYMLTSASCMDGLTPSSIQVWLTAHDSFEHHQASFGNVKLNVQQILMHPNYDRRTKDNDLCLVKLSNSVDISSSSYFVPACLPAGSIDFSGTTARVTGWSERRAYRMCKADMPVLDNKICNRDSKHAGRITGNMMCAGFLTPTRLENCIGDAGGPLVAPNQGRNVLIGIVSFGYEAKNLQYSPTVYARVSEFSDWILHNTRDADWCGI